MNTQLQCIKLGLALLASQCTVIIYQIRNISLDLAIHSYDVSSCIKLGLALLASQCTVIIYQIRNISLDLAIHSYDVSSWDYIS